MSLTYATDRRLDVETAVDLLRRSTLGERRPIDRPDVVAKMLEHAGILVTAWDRTPSGEELLVGLARSVTDFAYVAYLSDLAVDQAYQRQGIGRELIRRTEACLEPSAMLVLLAAPKAAAYYPHVGFDAHPSAWVKPPREG